jgi:diguanylate cyclase (GGDEF)-like protein
LDQGLFIALLNPAVSAVLAGAFLIVWCVRRHRYVLLIGLAYGTIGVGFLLQRFEMGMEPSIARFISTNLFLAAALLLGYALMLRRSLVFPTVLLGVCTAIAVGAVAWFMFVDPRFIVRAYALSFGLGAICLIIGNALRLAGPADFLDRALVWLLFLRGCDLISRPVLMSIADAGDIPYLPATETSFRLTITLTSLIFSLMTALFLFARVAVDALRELSIESRTDPLSGLLNRRGFDEGCAPFVGSHGFGLPLCLIIADLDRFKGINDIHGHTAGDAVIAAFGRLVREATEGRAVAGRIGGEEFAILIPGTTPAAARLLAEGLRAALAAGPLPGVPAPVGAVTCSFGVAAATGASGLEALYREADAALLRAKRAGRDRVEISWEAAVIPPSDQLASTASGS